MYTTERTFLVLVGGCSTFCAAFIPKRTTWASVGFGLAVGFSRYLSIRSKTYPVVGRGPRLASTAFAIELATFCLSAVKKIGGMTVSCPFRTRTSSSASAPSKHGLKQLCPKHGYLPMSLYLNTDIFRYPTYQQIGAA